MADPLSATGSITGIVSLGLMVCQGLISYYSCWVSQDDEIDHIVRKTQDLQNMFEVLQGPLQRLTTEHNSARSQVENSIRSCERSIDQLSKFLEKCKPVKTASALPEKLRDLRRKALFPFRKDALDQLRNALDDLLGNLSFALQVLQL